MTKSAEKPNSPDVYDTYLADLFREIEDAGCCATPEPRKAKTWVSKPNTEPVSLHEMLEPHPTPAPPYPLVFSDLPADALPNIERAVQIYRDHIHPLPATDIQGRAFALYVMAKEAAERHINKERTLVIAAVEAKKLLPSDETIEQYLNSDVLECRGEYASGQHHIDFFLLALMQLGMLYRKIQGGEAIDVMNSTVGIRESLQHGLGLLRLIKSALISSPQIKACCSSIKSGATCL